MNIIKKLQDKQPHLKPPNRLGCHLSFITYDKEKLLAIQEKYSNNYIWYHDHLANTTNRPVNTERFHYHILTNSAMNNEPYFDTLSNTIKEKIPLLKDVGFDYQFVKFDGPYELETHIDSNRNVVIFFPLTDNAAPTDFYRNNKKIKSFEHTSALLLSVDVPHGSSIINNKITFQIGFTYNNWNNLLDSCLSYRK